MFLSQSSLARKIKTTDGELQKTLENIIIHALLYEGKSRIKSHVFNITSYVTTKIAGK